MVAAGAVSKMQGLRVALTSGIQQTRLHVLVDRDGTARLRIMSMVSLALCLAARERDARSGGQRLRTHLYSVFEVLHQQCALLAGAHLHAPAQRPAAAVSHGGPHTVVVHWMVLATQNLDESNLESSRTKQKCVDDSCRRKQSGICIEMPGATRHTRVYCNQR